jgi:hypothetical protein
MDFNIITCIACNVKTFAYLRDFSPHEDTGVCAPLYLHYLFASLKILLVVYKLRCAQACQLGTHGLMVFDLESRC